MEDKFTHGPWTHYDDTVPAGKTGRHEIVALGRTVARIYYGDEQGAADARLIAAAPDLLQALIEMEREKSDYMLRNNLGNPANETTNKLARAAIAKATGAKP